MTIVMERPFESARSRPHPGLHIEVTTRREDVRSAVVRRAQVVRQAVILEMAGSQTEAGQLEARLKLAVSAAIQGRTEDLSGMTDDQLLAALCS